MRKREREEGKSEKKGRGGREQGRSGKKERREQKGWGGSDKEWKGKNERGKGKKKERKETGGGYGEGAVTPLAWFTHLALKFIAIHCLGCRQKEKTRDDAQSRKVLITKHWLKFFNFKLHLFPKCTRSYINHWKSLKDDKHGSLAKWSCSSL